MLHVRAAALHAVVVALAKDYRPPADHRQWWTTITTTNEAAGSGSSTTTLAKKGGRSSSSSSSGGGGNVTFFTPGGVEKYPVLPLGQLEKLRRLRERRVTTLGPKTVTTLAANHSAQSQERDGSGDDDSSNGSGGGSIGGGRGGRRDWHGLGIQAAVVVTHTSGGGIVPLPSTAAMAAAAAAGKSMSRGGAAKSSSPEASTPPPPPPPLLPLGMALPPFDLCVGRIMELLVADLFGEAAESKEAQGAMIQTIKEAKGQKSYDAIEVRGLVKR